MPSKALTVALSSIVAVTVACGLVESPPDLAHAAATAICGPADEAHTILYLAEHPIATPEPSYPYVRVLFLVPVSSLAGQTWDITTSLGPGTWYVVGPEREQPATSGRITVTSVDSANTIVGTVELRFPYRKVTIGFTARWVESLILCG